MVEHVVNMHEAMGSIPVPKGKKNLGGGINLLAALLLSQWFKSNSVSYHPLHFRFSEIW